MKKNINISVIGLGYVGLPLAIEFGKYFNTIGFDISKKKIKNLRKENAIDVITEYLELNQFGTANMPSYPNAKGANATIKHQFSSKTQSMVRSEFSETYKFITQRFGKEVPNAWLI